MSKAPEGNGCIDCENETRLNHPLLLSYYIVVALVVGSGGINHSLSLHFILIVLLNVESGLIKLCIYTS